MFRAFLIPLLLVYTLMCGCEASKPVDEKKANGEQSVAKVESIKPETKEPDQADVVNGLRHEDLDATLWLRTSGEYEAVARQAYRAALGSMSKALFDPAWTASTEQQKMADAGEIKLNELPPAVLLDVDETVLNNSGYQVRLMESKSDYTPETWKDYCRSETSTAIPGSVEFVNQCRSVGVQVLFVTNREHVVEPNTRANLIAEGLMKESDEDIVFSKYEKDEWKSDKVTRRKELATKYRILLLVGDDLHDFASTGRHPTPEARREFANGFSDWWGERWIVLPNPNYGGWEQSLYDWNNQSSSQTKLEKKIESLAEPAATTNE